MGKNKRMGRAYTLIEIIVVISIIAIVTGVGLAYYNQFSEEKKLEADAEKVADVLKLAQTKSISGDQSPQPTCTEFDGYQVVTSTNKFDLNYCCGSSCSTLIPIQTYQLTTGNQISSSTTISFQPLTGEVGSTITIKIQNTVLTPSKCYNVIVEAIGTVRTEKNYSCS